MAEKGNLDVSLEGLLGKLLDELSLINRKLDSLITLNKILAKQGSMVRSCADKPSPGDVSRLELDAFTLLDLPISLRKTVITLYKLESATAEDIAGETKRQRAVESGAANQLVRMGYLKKKREGRNVRFYLESREMDK